MLLRIYMSSLLLTHATWIYVACHLFVDSRRVLQLPHMYLPLFCYELTTVTYCCLGDSHDVMSNLQRIHIYAAL